MRVSGRYIKLKATKATLKLVAVAAANCVAKLVVVRLHVIVAAFVVAWRCADKFHKTKTVDYLNNKNNNDGDNNNNDAIAGAVGRTDDDLWASEIK